MRWRSRPVFRAAWWALVELARVRWNLPRYGLRTKVSSPPPLPRSALRTVRAILSRCRATCLERALIVQSWKLAHGEHSDIVIGVGNTGAFTAHAWIDGEDAESSSTFAELLRLPLAEDNRLPQGLLPVGKNGRRASKRRWRTALQFQDD